MFARLEKTHLKYCWMAAFAITAIFGLGFTPWQAVGELIANQGLSTEGIALIVYAAAYTFPATAGLTALFLIIDRGWLPVNGYLRLVLIITIFVVTTSVSQAYGIGRAISMGQPSLHTSGNPLLRLLTQILGAYLNSYGWGLMLAAVAIALASVASLSVLLRTES